MMCLSIYIGGYYNCNKKVGYKYNFLVLDLYLIDGFQIENDVFTVNCGEDGKLYLTRSGERNISP